MSDEKVWLSTREAAEVLGKTPTRVRQYTKEERWGLEVKPREPHDRIYISESSVYRLKRELEEHTAGRPKVKMASKSLRHLQYAKRAIEAIPLAPQYSEPIINLIDKFLQPKLEAWRADQRERDGVSKRSELQTTEPTEPTEPTEDTNPEPEQSEPKNTGSVRVLDFTEE